MFQFNDILSKVPFIQVIGERKEHFDFLFFDSRQARHGGIFFALPGTVHNGHDFIAEVIEHGTRIIVCEQMPQLIDPRVSYVQVSSTAKAMGKMAAWIYGNPSQGMKLVGVTGTNGKTTVSSLLFDLFTRLGHRCGLISTIHIRIVDQIIPTTHTTPDTLQLNKVMAQMLATGCEYVFMECSSHAIHQLRLEGLHFVGGVFTNLTHDHLDYHVTFQEYLKAKKMFFDGLDADAFALSNADDRNGEVILQSSKARRLFYGLTRQADYKGRILSNTLYGLKMWIAEREVDFMISGAYNASNLLAVYGVAIQLGKDKQEILSALSLLQAPEGRLEIVMSEKEKIMGVVDYAHTPDALENVLTTLNDARLDHQKIISVFGCGGDRDKSKRPKMARIGMQHSHQSIFTSDNPRSENALHILKDMQAGLSEAELQQVIHIPDRKEAIKKAVHLAQAGDIILIAGKGHEKYQIIGKQTLSFDDKEVLLNEFKMQDR